MFNITPPVHPGEILREEFLVPYGLTPYALAKMIKVPRTRVERLAREEASVTTDTGASPWEGFRHVSQFLAQSSDCL